ncbi:hypothetical protein [Dyella sp.]|uniref:hypothetical protein n=1 Tax=Dyella sp. TaxID=1869338 RepID=UPI003F8118A2
MTFKPNDPFTLACSYKGSQCDNAGRFRTGEPKASIAGRKGRWRSPWNDRPRALIGRLKRLELIKRVAKGVARG